MTDGNSVAMALDGLIVVLLVATIVYAVILSRRLGEIRRGKAEFENLTVALSQATVRAETAVEALRSLADQRGQALRQELQQARALRDDLDLLVERGTTLADDLTDQVRSSIKSSRRSRPIMRPDDGARSITEARALTRAARVGPPVDTASPSTGARQSGATPSKTEQALQRALRGVR
jgi:hypothetical protein